MTSSMTSYSSASSKGKWGTITWEIRSLNHRYLDLNFRLPEEFRQLEQGLRKLATNKLHRGKLDCTLKYQPSPNALANISLNIKAVKQLATATNKIAEQFKDTAIKINPLQVLAWDNVLKNIDEKPNAVHEKAAMVFNQALAKLIITRKREGAALQKFIEQKLVALSKQILQIKKLIPQAIIQQKNKLLKRLEEIKDKLEPNRLEQEMVFFAQKIDITEELERLETHIEELQKILQQNGAIGKRLDFLVQELNREANTIASKSSDKDITHLAVELKVLNEQIREQIQNIE